MAWNNALKQETKLDFYDKICDRLLDFSKINANWQCDWDFKENNARNDSCRAVILHERFLHQYLQKRNLKNNSKRAYRGRPLLLFLAILILFAENCIRNINQRISLRIIKRTVNYCSNYNGFSKNEQKWKFLIGSYQ